jgi:hypothetical protein
MSLYLVLSQVLAAIVRHHWWGECEKWAIPAGKKHTLNVEANGDTGQSGQE